MNQISYELNDRTFYRLVQGRNYMGAKGAVAPELLIF